MILILSALLAAQAAPPQPVVRLRCHMMECGWHQPLTSEVMARGEGYVLNRVTARNGRSVHRPGNYPRRYRRSLGIDWDAEPRQQAVLCSRRHPAALFRSDDGTWIAHQLNLFDLPGYAESSAAIYLNACHGLGRDALANLRRLRTLGYTAAGQTRQIELSAPEAILEHLPR